MEPIRYVDRLNEFYRSQGFPAYDWTLNESAPLTPLAGPLATCRVSMLRPGDREQQARILLGALQLVETAGEGGVLVDLPYDWGEDFAANV